MKFGIDFGTTRIVVARADRGNYPVLSYETPTGEHQPFVPPLIAARKDELRFGWEAWQMASDPSWTLVRSLKRVLESGGPATRVRIGRTERPLLELLTAMAASLRPADDPQPEACIGVPANANSNQRYLTAEAFRRAGFHVLGLLNEPSAAAIEYAQGNPSRSADDARLLVYDLGGGTFDVSLVALRSREHEILGTESIATLGGDDFDALLAELAVGDDALETLPQQESFLLLEACRAAKEGLNPNSRRMLIDLESIREGWGTASVAVAEFYERCQPLVNETIHAVEDLLKACPGPAPDCLYVTGGGSELPLVSRLLRERFGRRVKRSTYTREATAIGLAIAAEGASRFTLRERFSRYFGVWRETDGGRTIIFDPVFSKGRSLPGAGEPPLVVERSYHPVHNIGHFRYLEASAVGEGGHPEGNISLWDEIRFPFDPELREREDLEAEPVEYSARAVSQQIVERWSCDASGGVMVELGNRTSGYARKFELGRWSAGAAATDPVERPRAKRKKAKS